MTEMRAESFTNVRDVVMQEPEVGTTTLSSVMQDTRWSGDAVNWFYEHFVGPVFGDDEGLYDKLLKPIAGDFNLIKANGAAWTHASQMFWDTSANLSTNGHQLRARHWSDGEASEAFHDAVELIWVPGFYIVRWSCRWVGMGLDRLAKGTIEIAELCAKLASKVLERVCRLFVKAVPVLGWVVGLVDWVASGFDKFPYWDDVKEIMKLIDDVRKLHQHVEQMVAKAKAFFKGFERVLDGVKAIPDMGSMHGGLSALDGVAGGARDMAKAKEKFEEQEQKYLDQLGELGAFDEGPAR